MIKPEFRKKVDPETSDEVLSSIFEKADWSTDAGASVVFVSEAEIKAMNGEFRGLDEPTDVLAFESEDPSYIGDVFVCPKVVGDNAVRFGVPYQEEMVRVIVHGVLHLLGYDHKKEFRDEDSVTEKMFELQEKEVAKIVER